MKKTLIAVLASAAVASLATVASPAQAQDAGIVIMGSSVVVNQSAYGGRAYTTDYGEPSSYGRAAYTQSYYDRPAYTPSYYDRPGYTRSYYGRPAYVAESPYGGPSYPAARPSPSPSHYYGPLAWQSPSPCYWDRQRHWDGYSWRVRRIQVCD